MTPTRHLRTLLPAGLALFALAASGAEGVVPQGVVSLTSSASIEVVRDLLSVTFNTTREGADAAAVQSQLKQALDAALTETRKSAKPGQVEVQTGNFSLAPRYTNKGVVNGWQGSAELIVEGRDMQAIGQLSGWATTSRASCAKSPRARSRPRPSPATAPRRPTTRSSSATPATRSAKST